MMTSCQSHGSSVKELMAFKTNQKMNYMRDCLLQLPHPVQYRVLALKELQVKIFKKYVAFQKAKFQLDQLYKLMCDSINDKRYDLLMGKITPVEKETVKKWEESSENHIELRIEEVMKLLKMNERIKPIPEAAKGIPGFWLMVLKLIKPFKDNICAQDEPALQHLIDIKLVEPSFGQFIIEFHFNEQNGFFTNKILIKEYKYKTKLSDKNTLVYYKNEIISSEGCLINWIPGKKLPAKRQQKKLSDAGDSKTQTDVNEDSQSVQPASSFFNIFDLHLGNENMTGLFSNKIDFQMGLLLRDKVIAKAVLYLTGDIQENADNDEDDCEEEEQKFSGEEELDPAALEFTNSVSGN